MALFWSSRGRPSVCANSCGLLVGINKEQPSHSSSSLYLSASSCFCVFHLYLFLSIHQDFSIALSQQGVEGGLWSPSGVVSSQHNPLDTPRTEKVLLLPLDSFSPEPKLCLSLVDPSGDLLLARGCIHCTKFPTPRIWGDGWLLGSHFLCVGALILFY